MRGQGDDRHPRIVSREASGAPRNASSVPWSTDRPRRVDRRGRPATFKAPEISAPLVSRHRLEFLLELACHQRLTTVVAPPGYGKTVLLAQWPWYHQGHRIRWLTLGPQHNDRRLLMAAIRGALGSEAWPEPEAGPAVPELPELPPAATVDLALLEKLERLPPTSLVMDDFHELTDPALLDEVATLVEHAPRPLRFVIASQMDPPVRFYHLSLSDALLEIRQRDLAFTLEEAGELLDLLADVRLPAELVERLVGRTEGWAVGLQLAGLSLRSGADPEQFVDTFSGDDRGVADYLTEHVLSRLPDSTQDFLLRTSVVDRMSASLCDALTGRPGSRAVLEDLLRRSIFIAVDEPELRTFRYHQLFRTVLRGHLRQVSDGIEMTLLRIAADWHIGRGDMDGGLRLLAEAGSWDDAIDAVSTFGSDMLAQGRTSAVASVVSRTPEELRRDNVPAMLLEAAAWVTSGSITRALEVIDAVERRGSPSAAQSAVGGLLRSWCALREGRASDAVRGAEQVLRYLDSQTAGSGDPPDVLGLTTNPSEMASAAHAVRGAALLYEGRLGVARQALGPGRAAGHPIWQLTALGSLALVDVWSGRLSIAERAGRQGRSDGDRKCGARPPARRGRCTPPEPDCSKVPAALPSWFWTSADPLLVPARLEGSNRRSTRPEPFWSDTPRTRTSSWPAGPGRLAAERRTPSRPPW